MIALDSVSFGVIDGIERMSRQIHTPNNGSKFGTG